MSTRRGPYVVGMVGIALAFGGCASLDSKSAGAPTYEAAMAARGKLGVDERGGGAMPASISAAEAAALAVSNSPDLAADYATLALRERGWELGLRAYFPELSVAAGSDERLSEYSSDSFSTTLSLSVNQPVWDGGRRKSARALESAELRLTRAELDRKARDLGQSAVSSYRAVLAARERLAIRKASREEAYGERRVLETEIELGLATGLDLIEADMSLASMEIEEAEAEVEVSQSEADLAETLGVDALPELSDRFDIDRRPVSLDEGAFVKAAVERSPELETARYSITKAQAQADAAAHAWYPTIGVTAGAQVSGEEAPLTRSAWSVGISIDFDSPYLSGGSNVGGGGEPPYDSTANSSLSLEPVPNPAGAMDAKSAAVALSLEKERYRLLVGSVERSSRAALVHYANAVKQKDLSSKALKLAESKLGIVNVKVKLGQAVRSEVVEAELERAGKEVDLIDAVAAFLAAERVLEQLLDIPPDSLAAFASGVHIRQGKEAP